MRGEDHNQDICEKNNLILKKRERNEIEERVANALGITPITDLWPTQREELVERGREGGGIGGRRKGERAKDRVGGPQHDLQDLLYVWLSSLLYSPSLLWPTLASVHLHSHQLTPCYTQTLAPMTLFGLDLGFGSVLTTLSWVK